MEYLLLFANEMIEFAIWKWQGKLFDTQLPITKVRNCAARDSIMEGHTVLHAIELNWNVEVIRNYCIVLYPFHQANIYQ